ncbi:MAG: hypothetical protein CVU05_16070 [Bacteroidetes bacterium HGW-Bacteroidetes-21]|jgi:chemotaxis methyl-accepting protein methylase|nr:MAG: hypothetical protein CVU05_16070 [Bacteroidetes bacterium HGW-Bacteroidetes-21]
MKVISDFILLLKENYHIDFSGYETSFLKKTVNKRIAETGFDTINDYSLFLKKHPREVAVLTDSLQISYSDFFRNSLTFSVLEQIVIPLLIHRNSESKRKRLRLWSAACAGGQEPYSLAMLFEEIKSRDSAKYSYQIFATDLSEGQINEASAGKYSIEAISNVKHKRIKQWFTQSGEEYLVKQSLKKNINFSVFDLLHKEMSSPPVSIYGDFDIVFCANMLFYYKPKYQKMILEKVTRSMAQGGYLITGETERDILLSNNFREVFPQSAIFQKKSL